MRTLLDRPVVSAFGGLARALAATIVVLVVFVVVALGVGAAIGAAGGEGFAMHAGGVGAAILACMLLFALMRSMMRD